MLSLGTLIQLENGDIHQGVFGGKDAEARTALGGVSVYRINWTRATLNCSQAYARTCGKPHSVCMPFSLANGAVAISPLLKARVPTNHLNNLTMALWNSWQYGQFVFKLITGRVGTILSSAPFCIL